MFRYALLIEYDGGPFAGWQVQPGLATVQGVLEAAMARLDPSRPSVTGAGRTDAGVHALGQVAHVDLGREWAPGRLCAALNHHLRPAPVAMLAAAAVGAGGGRGEPGFHARFSAVERRYVYRLACRAAPLTHDRGRLWRIRHPLDLDAMREAAAHLVGRHDFTTFRAALCQAASPVKTLDALTIEAVAYPGGQELRFGLQARSFLHAQVRSMVGTLERVGTGAWTPERVAAALLARERSACGPVAPPDGLYLASVRYPDAPFGPAPPAS